MMYIRLTKYQEALVDDDLYDELNTVVWHTQVNKAYGFYAVRSEHVYRDKWDYTTKTIYMHRVILPPIKGMTIDHIDGNGLNNQRSNLRYATQSENLHNQRRIKPHSSQYKGVSWYKPYGKWRASIGVDGKVKNLGYFVNEYDAAIAYDRAAIEMFGYFARTNILRPK